MHGVINSIRVLRDSLHEGLATFGGYPFSSVKETCPSMEKHMVCVSFHCLSALFPSLHFSLRALADTDIHALSKGRQAYTSL